MWNKQIKYYSVFSHVKPSQPTVIKDEDSNAE